MDWYTFGSAFAGSFFGLVTLVAALLVWDYFDRRKKLANPQINGQKPKSLHDDILERHLEELVIADFDQLFPGWTIYSVEADRASVENPAGIRYRTPAGEIDILCLDQENNFVVIELKRNRAPDRVVSQLDRYLAWVEQNIAQTGQRVRGIIIARKHSDHVIYSVSRNADIELWTYELNLSLLPIVRRRVATPLKADAR